MSLPKVKSESYCVDGKHISGTKNIVGEITFNKKTGKDIKAFIGKCMIFDKRKSLIVSDNTIPAEGLGSFLKNLGKISAKAGKKLATNVVKNLRRALEIGANVATAAASKNAKNILSTLPEVRIFYHKKRGVYLGNFSKIMLYKWTKKQIDYIPQHH